jgi:hypothetical protein
VGRFIGPTPGSGKEAVAALAVELITDAGGPMGWTVFESAHYYGPTNSCPLACP